MELEEFKKQKIGNITGTRPTIVSKNEPMRQVLAKIRADVNHILVVAEREKTVGVVSWSDVLGKQGSDKTLEAENVIVKNPITISSSESVEDAVEKMSTYNLNKLVVLDEKERPVGIFSKKDIRDKFSKSFEVTL